VQHSADTTNDEGRIDMTLNQTSKCDLGRTIDRLRMGFQVIDFSWRYVYVNPAAAAQGRHSVADLIGRTIMETYPGIDQTPLFDGLQRCMTQRSSESFDNLFTFPDGEHRWFDLRIEPTEEGICIYSFDIHERKLRELANASAPNHLAAQQHDEPLSQTLWDSFVR
jgi:PAS domain-containing protein